MKNKGMYILIIVGLMCILISSFCNTGKSEIIDLTKGRLEKNSSFFGNKFQYYSWTLIDCLTPKEFFGQIFTFDGDKPTTVNKGSLYINGVHGSWYKNPIRLGLMEVNKTTGNVIPFWLGNTKTCYDKVEPSAGWNNANFQESATLIPNHTYFFGYYDELSALSGSLYVIARVFANPLDDSTSRGEYGYYTPYDCAYFNYSTFRIRMGTMAWALKDVFSNMLIGNPYYAIATPYVYSYCVGQYFYMEKDLTIDSITVYASRYSSTSLPLGGLYCDIYDNKGTKIDGDILMCTPEEICYYQYGRLITGNTHLPIDLKEGEMYLLKFWSNETTLATCYKLYAGYTDNVYNILSFNRGIGKYCYSANNGTSWINVTYEDLFFKLHIVEDTSNYDNYLTLGFIPVFGLSIVLIRRKRKNVRL